MPTTFTRGLLKLAWIGAVTAIAGCAQESSQVERPRLLSNEAARVENVAALERMGIELGRPMPARFVIEPCRADEFGCSSESKNADRID